MTTIVLTADVEEWAQSSWDRDLPVTEASARQCRELLDLLSDYPSARATFFVLGKFAARHPRVVEEIRDGGHEVACHGYGHVEIFRMTREEFAEDVRMSTELIAAAACAPPIGYRAPDFSIVPETLWALEVLSDLGYRYDSSIFPIRKARYGIEGWPPVPASVALRSGQTIVELPVATVAAARWRLPAGGGGYARLLPGAVVAAALRRAERETGAPPVFYCHPYELDAGELARFQPPLPRRVRLHQGLGRRSTARKLRHLLEGSRCIAAEDAMRELARPRVVEAAQFEKSPAGARPMIPGMTARRLGRRATDSVEPHDERRRG